jgi:hypothetical protein
VATIYKTGIGLKTGFIGSHTVTHNYSVYTLTAHYTCRVSSLCLHWLPVFQYLTRLALQDWLTGWQALGPNTHSSVFWRLALCNSLDSTAPAHTRRPTDWLTCSVHVTIICPCIQWLLRLSEPRYLVQAVKLLPRAGTPIILTEVCHHLSHPLQAMEG